MVEGPPPSLSISLPTHSKITPHTLRFINELISANVLGKEVQPPVHVAAVNQQELGTSSTESEADKCNAQGSSKGSNSNLTDGSLLIPSIVQPPILELKDLPSNLKYAYMDANNKLPVIISNSLNESEEASLLSVLAKNREALGWQLSDIKGLDPTVCTHKILLTDDSKPVK